MNYSVHDMFVYHNLPCTYMIYVSVAQRTLANQPTGSLLANGTQQSALQQPKGSLRTCMRKLSRHVPIHTKVHASTTLCCAHAGVLLAALPKGISNNILCDHSPPFTCVYCVRTALLALQQIYLVHIIRTRSFQQRLVWNKARKLFAVHTRWNKYPTPLQSYLYIPCVPLCGRPWSTEHVYVHAQQRANASVHISNGHSSLGFGTCPRNKWIISMPNTCAASIPFASCPPCRNTIDTGRVYDGLSCRSTPEITKCFWMFMLKYALPVLPFQ